MTASTTGLLAAAVAFMSSALFVGTGDLPPAAPEVDPASPAAAALHATTNPADPVAPAILVRDTTTEVGWRVLAGLNYRTGEKTDELAALDGELVRVPGFTVPLEDFASSATEFLLVPYVGACIHTPPPPPNQLVYIEMDQGKRAKMDGWNPVWVEGVLTIEMTESVYGYVGYTITGHRVFPYQS